MRIVITSVSAALAFGFVGACTTLDTSSVSSALTGAVFTTLEDGTRVDENIYDFKEDVYLDGGPGENAPPGAAALPDGDYYFQVTDPGCKELLSEDALSERIFTIENGEIVSVSGHVTGTDEADGGLTVQLMPYADTPNSGGEYKVHVTAVDDYDPDGPGDCFGFVPADSKTDNYKALGSRPPLCPNGYVDPGEECDDGNSVNGDGCSAECELEKQPCCGDGYVDEGEQCDDGNTTNGDGCSAECTLEKEPCCGDGYVDEGEECDDGNTTNGDGCSSVCTLEKVCEPTL